MDNLILLFLHEMFDFLFSLANCLDAHICHLKKRVGFLIEKFKFLRRLVRAEGT